jgi:hypothetical protein
MTGGTNYGGAGGECGNVTSCASGGMTVGSNATLLVALLADTGKYGYL